MTKICIQETPKTDVLVLGGGLCGMYAAIEADRAGKQVALLSKGRVGLSGSSVVSMSVHRFAPDDPELREEYRLRFLRSGGGQQNPFVAQMLVDQGEAAVKALREFGVPLEYHRTTSVHGNFCDMACCRPKLGRYLTEPLRGYLKEHTSVTLHEGEMAFELVAVGGQIAGVLAERAGRVTFYPAGAVVLATGGGGNVYSRTSNPKDLTGDGYAMAQRLGLPLAGMEFVQFYPYRTFTPRVVDLFPDIFTHGAAYRNRQGERFMENDPGRELENRDVLCQAMFQEGEVFLDLSGCDLTYLERECPNLAKLNKEYSGAPVEVCLTAHFFMGGVPLRPDCSTGVGGLFACGEVTGGLHGANRLSGSALTEAALFGRIAGRRAGAWSPVPIAPSEALKAAYRSAGILPEQGTEDLNESRRALQKEMWAHASVVRTPGGLRHLKQFLDGLELEQATARSDNLRAWLELRDLIQTAQAVVTGALRRKESLGAHFMNHADERCGRQDRIGGNDFAGYQNPITRTQGG